MNLRSGNGRNSLFFLYLVIFFNCHILYDSASFMQYPKKRIDDIYHYEISIVIIY